MKRKDRFFLQNGEQRGGYVCFLYIKKSETRLKNNDEKMKMYLTHTYKQEWCVLSPKLKFSSLRDMEICDRYMYICL